MFSGLRTLFISVAVLLASSALYSQDIYGLANSQLIRFDLSGSPTVLVGSGVSGAGRNSMAIYEGDTETIAYVGDTTGRRVIRYNDAGQSSVYLNTSNGILDPYAIAVDRSGRLFVSDIENNNIRVFTSPSTSFVFADGADGLAQAESLTIDGDGYVYAANAFDNKIYRFDSSGTGTLWADAADGVARPIALAADSQGNLYVSNFTSGNILKIDSFGVGTVFADSSDDLDVVTGLTIDEGDNVYVACFDFSAGKILKFSSEGVASVFIAPTPGVMYGNLAVAIPEPSVSVVFSGALVLLWTLGARRRCRSYR